MRRLVPILVACGLCTVVVCLAAARRQKAPQSPERRQDPAQLTDIVDHVKLWDAASRQSHAVRWARGEVTSTRATFGRLQVPVRGIALEPGGVVYVTVDTAAPAPSALAVRLATTPEHFGKLQSYSIDADGAELCNEAAVDPGAGSSRTVFVELDSPGRSATVAVRAGWRNTFPIVVEAVRVYPRPDAAALASPPEPRWRMGLALLTSRGHGFSMDAEEMRRIAGLIPASEWTVAQSAVLYNFCKKQSYQQQADAMRQYADLAATVRFPLRVLPQMHWAGIPSGVPDGAGGTFTDVPYQQITWDPDDQTDDPGLKALLGERYDIRYGLSVPNRWGNTPWLTFNHPRLNQYRRIRLQEALRAWLAARERLGRWGLAGLFPMEISTGEETVYWAKGVDDSGYTAHNGGKPRTALLADFNPFVVADALNDRIILDPSNDLDRNERWWLHQNLARWQQSIVNWMLEAVPADPIRTTPAGPVFAEDIVRRNIFTEPYAMPVFPMRGVNPWRPGLEVGYVHGARSGGEYWSGATMLPWLIKERERGRIALPNLECTGADDGQLRACLLAAFACGARYATLYNWHYRSNIRQILTETLAAIRAGAGHLLPEAAKAEPQSATAERVFRGPADAFGVNILTAIAPDGVPEGTAVRLSIRTLDEKPERRAAVTVLAAKPQNGSSLTGRLPVPFHTTPGARYALSAEVVISRTADQAAPLRLRPTGAYMDVRVERWRSFAVADWQDAADIIAALESERALPRMNPEAAARLELARRYLDRGRPLQAYRAAVRAEQLLYPCTFIVPAPGGRLTPFPVAVMCPEDRLRVTISDLGPRSASVMLLSNVPQTVEVRYRGRRTQATLAANMPTRVDLDVAP